MTTRPDLVNTRGSTPLPPIEIYPVIYPAVDWQLLISQSQDHLGSSLTRRLDKANIPISLASFVQAINALENPSETNLTKFLDVAYMDCVSMGFLLVAPEDVQNQFMRSTKVTGTGKPTFRIYTADLIKWQFAVCNCCQRDRSVEIRYIGNRLFTYFNQAGFSLIFTGYNKEPYTEGTFVLCKQ